MLRQILSVLAGLLTVSIVVGLVQALGHYAIPMPQGLDANDPDVVKNYVDENPMAMVFVLLSYAAGAFLGGFVATLIAKDNSRSPVFIIGALYILVTIYMMFIIPSPFWFWVLGIAFWGLVFVGRTMARNIYRKKLK